VHSITATIADKEKSSNLVISPFVPIASNSDWHLPPKLITYVK